MQSTLALPAVLFAATKIQPPRQRRVRVQRAALEGAMAAALRSVRTVLLQAPAGYGKTSLLAALTAGLPAGAALAWVSMDDDDDDARFMACLCAALEPFDLPWRIAPEALAQLVGQDGDSGRKRALAELVNALAGAERAQGVIVLDDLHRVPQGQVFGLLETLVERLPQGWSVVLSSRVMPPLPLARWLAAGELRVFGQDELAFSAEEAAALATAEGAAERADELYRRTRGWPAGLRLLLTAPQRPGRELALGRDVSDFLASEVLQGLPQGLHDFLLRVSVLPEMTAVRAAAVSGDADAARWFDEIERRGLFATVLDTHERTLVLHDLFRESLLERLRRRWPGEEPQLLRRAADSEPDAARRVGYLLRARDWARAEQALAEAAPEMLLTGGMRELQRLVDAFDPAWRDASPRLLRLAGMASSLRWDWEAMSRQMQASQVAARARGDRAEQDLAEAYLAGALYPMDQNADGEALIAQLEARTLSPDARRLTLMADCAQRLRRGEMAVLPALYGELLELLQPQQGLLAWWESVPPFNWTTVPGMSPLIERYVQGALARIGGRPLPMRADVNLLRVFTRLWQGRLTEAATEAAAVEADRRWLACSGELDLGLAIVHLITAAVHGRPAEVERQMQWLFAREDGARDERRRLWQHHMAIYGLRMADTLGATDRATAIAHWATFLKEDPLRSAASDNHRAIGVRARHAAAQGRWADAAEGFVRLLPQLGRIDVMGHGMDLRLRAAHALLQVGRLDEAAVALAPALQRVRDEGVRGQTLLAGPAVLSALADARWGQRLAVPLQDELRALAPWAAGLRGATASSAVPDEDADADGLSSREREVLQCLAAGDSNKLIARALDISPHTVKRHVANILDKLALSSRGRGRGLVARARLSARLRHHRAGVSTGDRHGRREHPGPAAHRGRVRGAAAEDPVRRAGRGARARAAAPGHHRDGACGRAPVRGPEAGQRERRQPARPARLRRHPAAVAEGRRHHHPVGREERPRAGLQRHALPLRRELSLDGHRRAGRHAVMQSGRRVLPWLQPGHPLRAHADDHEGRDALRLPLHARAQAHGRRLRHRQRGLRQRSVGAAGQHAPQHARCEQRRRLVEHVHHALEGQAHHGIVRRHAVDAADVAVDPAAPAAAGGQAPGPATSRRPRRAARACRPPVPQRGRTAAPARPGRARRAAAAHAAPALRRRPRSCPGRRSG
ncbi:MAG: LuxR C-terminal-related transcriptional regulator [Rubrivivax sp.]